MLRSGLKHRLEMVVVACLAKLFYRCTFFNGSVLLNFLIKKIVPGTIQTCLSIQLNLMYVNPSHLAIDDRREKSEGEMK